MRTYRRLSFAGGCENRRTLSSIETAGKYTVSNSIEYTCLRVGHTVMIMAPLMCAYSNLINMIQFHWSFGQFLAAVVSKTPVNWIFAFCVQVWLLTPLNKKIFGLLFKKQLTAV